MTSSKDVKKDKTNKKSFYKQWWFWVIVVLVIALIGTINSQPECPVCVTSDNASNQSAQSSDGPVVNFEQVVLNGVGINVTNSISLPRGTYAIEYSVSNNFGYSGNRGTNFISNLHCDDDYENITNIIESSSNGTKVIKQNYSNTAVCFIEVKNASDNANWSFTINKK